MSLIVPAVSFKQRKVQMYVAAVPLNALESFSIDIFDTKNVIGRRGYQRRPDDHRISKIAQFFENKDAIMPMAGLLNVREKTKLKYSSGMLTIPDGTKVWVVDMQHRLRGLVRAQEEGILKDGFMFPVVITEGLTQVDEAAQFYIINTKAKKMDVALTRRLLIENDRVRELADARPWEIAAVKATIDLNKNLVGNPWYDRLRQPNEERHGQHIATETSFVSSLRNLFIGTKSKKPSKVARELSAFWMAIEGAIPKAFQDPRHYLIQRTPGMFTFNFYIAPLAFAKWPVSEFPRRLSKLDKLGADFWRRNNKRGARRFGTGMGGYANLASHVRKVIQL